MIDRTRLNELHNPQPYLRYDWNDFEKSYTDSYIKLDGKKFKICYTINLNTTKRNNHYLFDVENKKYISSLYKRIDVKTGYFVYEFSYDSNRYYVYDNNGKIQIEKK